MTGQGAPQRLRQGWDTRDTRDTGTVLADRSANIFSISRALHTGARTSGTREARTSNTREKHNQIHV